MDETKAKTDSLTGLTDKLSDDYDTVEVPTPEKPKKEKKNRHGGAMAAGIITLIFAIVGIVATVMFGVGKIKTYSDEKKTEKLNYYNNLLIAAAAIDIEPFDDITSADMSELVEMSVWSVVYNYSKTESFEYSSGNLVVPEENVEAEFTKYFGTQRQIEHMTVTGYGYEFTYDQTEKAYLIPITTLTPIYTPKCTETEKKGNAVTVTAGLINSDMWLQDRETGDITTPEPDKYIKVTFREENDNSYISAIRTLSALETASTASSGETTADTYSDTSAQAETTQEN